MKIDKNKISLEMLSNNQIDDFTKEVRKVVTISKENDNLIVKLVSLNKQQAIIKRDGKEILGSEHTYPKKQFNRKIICQIKRFSI